MQGMKINVGILHVCGEERVWEKRRIQGTGNVSVKLSYLVYQFANTFSGCSLEVCSTHTAKTLSIPEIVMELRMHLHTHLNTIIVREFTCVGTEINSVYLMNNEPSSFVILSCSVGGGMTKKIRENAVYITQLPPDVTMEKLAELFGSIGVIKVWQWN